MRDHSLIYPDLFLEIFVAGDWDVRDDESRFAKMFSRARCTRAASPDKADLVIFGGGSDVNPALYGAEVHDKTYFNSDRDTADTILYTECLEKGIPMFGVCRGAQFLHVANGGSLYQDLDNHYGDHRMWDLVNKAWIDKVSSVHHQACRPNVPGGMTILATACVSTERHIDNSEVLNGHGMDVEAFFYRDTACLGVQGHPEYDNYPYYTKWCLDLIENFVNCNPDIEYVSGKRRIKPSLLEERKLTAVTPEEGI
jgi:gamma-glutamyl-gamma-aminobutyrate hydrolase PuuD